ncbi:hypothetical protein H5410_061120 [Solanum commersonii]|uniref:Uncharacterized protein n=1 Tax=Solanum commersonii TaxID=4109 RepID=A0A9J5W752_SOLCO|nr:hypothetical protein H5410_061120 [Solanum commersonii]
MALHRRIVRRLTDCSFLLPTRFSPSGLGTLEHLCPCFVPQSKYLKFKDLHQLLAQNMHLRTKSATQDSIMNAHNKTQLTHGRINCALKDSSCDSPLSKNLKLTLLASDASSNSTKGCLVFSNQHLLQLAQDQKGLIKACNGAECKCIVI